MVFTNRHQAAELLADALAAYKGRHPLILAIPRGAVAMRGSPRQSPHVVMPAHHIPS